LRMPGRSRPSASRPAGRPSPPADRPRAAGPNLAEPHRHNRAGEGRSHPWDLTAPTLPRRAARISNFAISLRRRPPEARATIKSTRSRRSISSSPLQVATSLSSTGHRLPALAPAAAARRTQPPPPLTRRLAW
jgi:hypothetical protein